MAPSQELLEQAAQDGTWSSEEWSIVLEDVLTRLDNIIREFPVPVRPPSPPPPPQLGSPLHDPLSQDSTTSNKENAPARPSPSTPRPPVPSFPAVETTRDEHDLPSEYPSDLITLHRSIRKNLKAGFPKYPPHTVQRLAELVLWPKKYYRFLPSYLNALDRVVSVQSTTELYPLPMASLPSTGGMLNGASATPVTTRNGPELGSDESLGGALLTPIPWLANRRNSEPSTGSSATGGSSASEKELQTSSTEMVEGPNGAGRIETVSVVNGVMTIVSNSAPTTEETLRSEGAVTQGELLRQEQEAGVVPVSPRGMRMSDEEMNAAIGGDGAEAEQAHARGPEEIGDEDIGPQHGHLGGVLDLEAAVGRSRRDSSVDPEDASLSDAGGGREEEMPDAGGADDVERSSDIIDEDAKDAPAQPDEVASGSGEQDK